MNINILLNLDINLLLWLQNHRLVNLVIKSRKRLRNFFILFLTWILSATIGFLLKLMIARPRPFDTYSFIIKLSQAGGFSFPSGHTMEAFCVATSLALLFPEKKIILPAFLWAVLVAYSRLALGVHFPSDILGGVVMGAVSATSVFYLMRKYELKRIL